MFLLKYLSCFSVHQVFHVSFIDIDGVIAIAFPTVRQYRSAAEASPSRRPVCLQQPTSTFPGNRAYDGCSYERW